jgi:sugar-specific transcriptional regulator TrmB
MRSLQNCGLVLASIDKPKKYKAVPLRNGISILLKNKKLEIEQIEKSTEKMEERINKYKKTTPGEEKTFMIAHSALAPPPRVYQAFSRVQESVDMFFASDSRVLEQGLTSNYRMLEETLDRNVQMRIISQSFKKNNLLSTHLEKLMVKPKFEIKFRTYPQVGTFLCFDKNEVWLKTGKTEGLDRQENIVMDYGLIGELFHFFFEKIWNENNSLQDALR